MKQIDRQTSIYFLDLNGIKTGLETDLKKIIYFQKSVGKLAHAFKSYA